MGRLSRDVAERFWEKVDRRGFDECWPWLAGTHRQGYGKFELSPGQLGVEKVGCYPAHRIAFYLIYGRWPELWALHGCDNPPCCNAENPEHVHEGTPSQNMLEMVERGRQPDFDHRVPRPQWRGERSWSAKLTQVQADEIRVRYAAGGISQLALGLQHGVSEMTVNRILHGRRYVPDGWAGTSE